MIYDAALYEPIFMKNNKTARDKTASTMHKFLFALFPDSETVNKPTIFLLNSARLALIFCIRREKKMKHKHNASRLCPIQPKIPVKKLILGTSLKGPKWSSGSINLSKFLN